MKIPVGLASIVGIALGAVQLVLAAVAYLNGEHTTAQHLLITGNAAGLLTMAGRYVQAHKQIASTIAHVETTAAAILPSAEKLPSALEALGKEAQANVAVAQASPDHVQTATVPFSGAPGVQAQA